MHPITQNVVTVFNSWKAKIGWIRQTLSSGNKLDEHYSSILPFWRVNKCLKRSLR